MLEKIRIERYKSLYDVTIALEPLTVFIGPNGSGKSNICEALFLLSKLVVWLEQQKRANVSITIQVLQSIMKNAFGDVNIKAKFWHGEEQTLRFSTTIRTAIQTQIQRTISVPAEFVELPEIEVIDNLRNVKTYDFSPSALAQPAAPTITMERSGQGIAYALADILFNDRQKFNELEERFIELVPHISRIILDRQPQNNQFLLFLKDKFSNHLIPAADISDGTLRLLAFLTALYEDDSQQIICFEEPENGIHPWLLHKLIDLLMIVTTKGVRGSPVQVLITTHSPAFLNLVRPDQVRAVELDQEGKTRVHSLPVGEARFQKALETFEGDLCELWFVDMFGGNP
ncbi:MAG: ATP-binding protein [Caldilineaceae bacterium]